MKKILIIILAFSFINATKIKAPDWVPEKHRVLFVSLIKTSQELQRTSQEYSEVLKTKPEIVECNLNGKEVIFIIKRKHISNRVSVVYDIPPISCEIVENSEAYMVFDKKNMSTWEKFKDYSIKIIIGIGIGFLLGKTT